MHIRLLFLACLFSSLFSLQAQTDPSFPPPAPPTSGIDLDQVYYQDGIIFQDQFHQFYLLNYHQGYRITICRRMLDSTSQAITSLCDTSFLIAPRYNRTIFRTAVANVMANLHRVPHDSMMTLIEGDINLSYQVDGIYDNLLQKPVRDSLREVSVRRDDLDDKAEYAGELTLTSKASVLRQRRVSSSTEVIQLYEDMGAVSRREKYGLFKRMLSPDKFYNLTSDEILIYIKGASIKTDLNRLEDIAITFSIEGDTTELVLRNRDWSLPFSNLLVNSGKRHPIWFEHKGWRYRVYFEELLTFAPYREKFTYVVKNNAYFLEPGKSQKIEQRGISDFMGIVVLADPLGFTDRDPNNIMQVEATTTIPFNLKNGRRNYWFSQFHAALNFSVINGVDKELRFAPYRDWAADKIEIDNLDFVRYSNVNFRFLSSIYAREIKRLNSFLHFESGIRMFRSSYRTSDTSSIMPVSIWTPVTQVNMSIRPDYAFGSNINVGLMWPRLLLNSSIEVPEPDLISNGMAMISTEANFYAFTNPTHKKGGIFLRYVAYHDLHRRGYFPQILIGYATNLRGLIKNTIPK